MIEKGLVRLKFKHPMKHKPVLAVLPALKPLKRCWEVICCPIQDASKVQTPPPPSVEILEPEPEKPTPEVTAEVVE